uniref:M20 aminoacylase family protein n=1 Tax=Acinetobacter pittii TaxID=48296 RepID=UPI002B1BD087|nr:M20 aminoacylase family protein [Acinetobacter pittii]
MITWRRRFHRFPEIGFQEVETSKCVASLLRSFGLEVVEGIAGTGVVATLENGSGPTIGLRADMDALPFTELGDIPHKSCNHGAMHACGHDGHTAMLIGAAKYLSENRNFRGKVHFVFQPAEENLGGASKMLEEGLLDRFPMSGIYGLHNWPGLPAGHIAVNPGAMMASLDSFEIQLEGKSCHAAMPEMGLDPIVGAAQLILSIQTITSRRLAAQDSAVLSITQIHGGEAINVIPEYVTIKGTFRCLDPKVRQKVQQLLQEMVDTIPLVHGVKGRIEFFSGYPVTLNHLTEAMNIRDVAIDLLGESKVHWNIKPSMASEDFSYFLEECSGAYFWLGVDEVEPSKPLHNAYYDFNDNVIETGIQFWVALVEKLLLK